jgi:hypothetical protein
MVPHGGGCHCDRCRRLRRAEYQWWEAERANGGPQDRRLSWSAAAERLLAAAETELARCAGPDADERLRRCYRLFTGLLGRKERGASVTSGQLRAAETELAEIRSANDAWQWRHYPEGSEGPPRLERLATAPSAQIDAMVAAAVRKVADRATLANACIVLGQLVALGRMDLAKAERTMRAPARKAGLPAEIIERAVTDGLLLGVARAHPAGRRR